MMDATRPVATLVAAALVPRPAAMLFAALVLRPALVAVLVLGVG
jgi:hypothetical protein